ncbi:UNVERIFIED_CONTAM: GDP-L-galactose phosphorylase 1 [Sesamum angustifolium]|uniref:GDP-L-galactose phosphorylase 1 n=1 Tax=Sesamum angustifolium TaxID=2727405 RepID=A0AAW2PDI8_9LAMI
MMLRIKRVPTVVSNYQKEEAEEGAGHAAGCGRNCLRSCCLPGAKLPLYAFNKASKVVSEKDSVASENDEPPVDFLDSLLLAEWEDRMQRGLFRYDVTACETKVIPGKYGFIAQLNEGRHLKKRPTEFRVDKVLQPFDENKFNFTKVGQEELLFQFEPSKDNDVKFIPKAPINTENSPSVVAINVSPIEYGHVLLIPRILECLPQRIDPWVHLRPSIIFTSRPITWQPFPIERAPSKKIITTSDGVKISDILNYPVRGLVFEGGNTLEDLSNVVSDSCICLQENNIPYNVLIADSGKRVFLFPQCYAEKQALGEVSSELLDTQVNPAVWEISGHMVLKRKEDYEEASEENAWRLLAEVSLSEARLQEVKELIFETICCHLDENKDVTKTPAQESAVTPPSHEDVDAIKGSHRSMVPV